MWIDGSSAIRVRALVQFAVCPSGGLGTPAGGDGSLHSGLCPMEESHIWKNPIVFILPPL